jgi:virginiamycin B lyase
MITSRKYLLLPFAAAALTAQQSGTTTHKRIMLPKPGVSDPGVRIPMSAVKPDAVYPVPGAPDWIAVGEDVWVSNRPKGNVTRLDPVAGTVKQVIDGLPGACSGLAIGFGSLWVPTCGDRALARVDLVSGKVTARIPLPVAESEGGLAVGAGSVWLLSSASSVLARLDPETNKVTKEIHLPEGCYTAAFGFEAVWVTCSKQNTLVRVDPATNSVVATVSTGPAPRFLSAGEGAVWTLNQADGSVTRVDPATNRAIATIAVGIPGPGGDISAAEGSVWATSFGFPISRIDPATNKVAQQFVGDGGDAIRAGKGSVWLSSLKAGVEWRINVQQLQELSRK